MKKKLIAILLCAITITSVTACGKRIDMDALKEEVREEILEEMEEEQKKEEREAEKEARRAEREAEKENEEQKEQKENEPLEDEPKASAPAETKTPVAGSTEWTSMTFALDGKTYAIPFSYEDIKSDWSFDLADYGYEDGYILNPNEYVYSTIELENDAYDCTFYIGLENNDTSAKDITECDIWAASIDITWADSYPTLELPGGLTWGSSLEEVEALYGIPESTYRSESLGYWSYDYAVDNTYMLSLTIYDENGITEFRYKLYD